MKSMTTDTAADLHRAAGIEKMADAVEFGGHGMWFASPSRKAIVSAVTAALAAWEAHEAEREENDAPHTREELRQEWENYKKWLTQQKSPGD